MGQDYNSSLFSGQHTGMSSQVEEQFFLAGGAAASALPSGISGT